jgi:hypothetical protein
VDPVDIGLEGGDGNCMLTWLFLCDFPVHTKAAVLGRIMVEEGVAREEWVFNGSRGGC